MAHRLLLAHLPETELQTITRCWQKTLVPNRRLCFTSPYQVPPPHIKFHPNDPIPVLCRSVFCWWTKKFLCLVFLGWQHVWPNLYPEGEWLISSQHRTYVWIYHSEFTLQRIIWLSVYQNGQWLMNLWTQNLSMNWTCRIYSSTNHLIKRLPKWKMIDEPGNAELTFEFNMPNLLFNKLYDLAFTKMDYDWLTCEHRTYLCMNLTCRIYSSTNHII